MGLTYKKEEEENDVFQKIARIEDFAAIGWQSLPGGPAPGPRTGPHRLYPILAGEGGGQIFPSSFFARNYFPYLSHCNYFPRIISKLFSLLKSLQLFP